MPYIDFKQVKTLVTMEELLVRYGVRFIPKSQLHNLSCPFPSHVSKDKNALSVNLERNIWSCKSQSCVAGREGKEGGNVLDFVMLMEGMTAHQAGEKILEWYDLKKQKPRLATEALAQTQTNVGHENSRQIPEIQANSAPVQPRRPIGFQPPERKIPPEPEMHSSGVRADNPSPPVSTTRSGPVKVKGHMKEVDVWFDSLISDPPDWQKIRNAVKARLIESWRNGKAAAS